MEKKTDAVVVLSTAPEQEAGTIARILVEEHLAACVNIAFVRSCYLWKGDYTSEDEALMIIKAQKDAVGRLIDRIKSLHSYELPEAIVLPIIGGYPPYLAWLAGERRE
jgi:periplasmic divalent cation tolerance protein